MNFLKLTVITAVTAAATSCGGIGQTGDPVTRAEALYEDGRYAEVQTMCDSLVTPARINSLSVDQLCRLTLMFIKLADYSAEDDNIAMATRCFRDAGERSADSVSAFFQKCPLDQQSQLLLLSRISQSLSERPDSITDETPIIIDEADSMLAVEPAEYHDHPNRFSQD